MQWEYRTVKLGARGVPGGIVDTDDFEKHLNELGEQSWELVAAFDANQSGGQTRDVIAVLKRPN